jgi:phosphoribosylformylglycinamidine cyclo-ligase
LEKAGLKLEQYIDDFQKTMGEELLTPTRIYVKTIMGLVENVPVNGMAHITGGGITENLQRILPVGLGAVIDASAIEVKPVFQLVQRLGQVEKAEMFRTFNMGIGFTIVVSSQYHDKVVKYLRDRGEKPIVIGRISSSEQGVVVK